MKKLLSIFCVILIAFLLLGCLCESFLVTDPMKYGKWNLDTKRFINEHFENSLPDVEFAENYCCNYYYSYKHAFLGDQNFVIYADFKVPNKTDYYKKINIFNEMNGVSCTDGREFYFLQGDEKNISLYLDDEILDGMFYDLEIIVTDKDNQTINYLIAHVWDYYRDEMLFNFLKKICNTGDGTVCSGES